MIRNYDREKRAVSRILFFFFFSYDISPIYTPHLNPNVILPFITMKIKKERIFCDDNILWESNHTKIIEQNQT